MPDCPELDVAAARPVVTEYRDDLTEMPPLPGEAEDGIRPVELMGADAALVVRQNGEIELHVPCSETGEPQLYAYAPILVTALGLELMSDPGMADALVGGYARRFAGSNDLADAVQPKENQTSPLPPEQAG